MERRQADRRNWKRILERQFDVVYLQTPAFTGYVTRLLLHQVSEPLHREILGRRYCLADSGYCWLQHFPASARHTVTTMIDGNGAVIQWYIDICASHGIDADGIPWFEDLYLDIVVLPSREAVLLDNDELEAALLGGEITETQYDLARQEAHVLLHAIANGAMRLLDLTVEHLRDYFAASPFSSRSSDRLARDSTVDEPSF